MKRVLIYRLVLALLLAIMFGLILYKTLFLRETLPTINPIESYRVTLNMEYTGYGGDVTIKTYIPKSEQGQDIEVRENSGLKDAYEEALINDSKFAIWHNYRLNSFNRLTYTFIAQNQEVLYNIPKDQEIVTSHEDYLLPFLKETDTIQVNSKEVNELAQELRSPNNNLYETLNNIYTHISKMENREFKGTTDALTALKLNAASCNGKSRLFIAITRSLGIPSRLVGGLILNNGSKKTTHQWVEIFYNGHWLPIDALNNHFLVKPENYLTLYRGDEVMFKYSRDINFDYNYSIKKVLSLKHNFKDDLKNSNLNLYSYLSSFNNINISLELIRLLLMIPVGVLIVVISRNIIGISTFGTFLPALLAVSLKETGLLTGIFGIVFILGVVLTIRLPLQKLGVLHTPKLAIMMLGVIFSILGLFVIANYLNIEAISNIGSATLFPIAILTITTERVAISIEEEGIKKTLSLAFNTIIVLILCYFTITSVTIQSLFLGYPELILGVIALNLFIGSWIGIRVTEIIRFKSLLFKKEIHG